MYDLQEEEKKSLNTHEQTLQNRNYIIISLLLLIIHFHYENEIVNNNWLPFKK